MKDLMKFREVYDWALQWYEDFQRNMEANPSRFTINIDRLPTDFGYRIVTVITNGYSSGEAICNESDKYDFRLGIAVAWAKLYNIQLPSTLRPDRYGDLLLVLPGDRFEYGGTECRVISATRSTDNEGNEYRLLTVWCEDEDWFDLLTVNVKASKKDRKVKLLS